MNDKLKHIALNYLNKEYSGLTIYETDKWKNYIFFIKNDKVIFEYNKENGKVYISYEHIWSFLSSFFGLRYTEIQDLTKEWVEEQFKLSVTTTERSFSFLAKSVEEQFKLSVTTTGNYGVSVLEGWRNITN
jgi:predicted transcriptional regulator